MTAIETGGEVVITVAPNGARRGRAEHAAIPLTPEEIAAEAGACEAAGAAILHLHVRDGNGLHSLDPGRYREAMAAVAGVCGLVVQPTTERAGRFGPAEMMAVQRALAPEMISLNLEELLDGDSGPEQAAARDFLAEIHAAGTIPQYIVYAPGQLERLRAWWERGWVPQQNPYVLLVIGRYAGPPGRRADLLAWLPLLPAAWAWGVCAFGPEELAINALAALAGGHCRVGFENNLERRPGEPLAGNSDQVGRLGGVLAELGVSTATAAQARIRFGIQRP
ncbi:MAG: 3-keto-5-aminohexanoate cleavage protein [Gammaproteobacteria bacterium]|nr:3-keto-5-aminohexanoate cleavage protein [Gammaproteobacteria bacterium]